MDERDLPARRRARPGLAVRDHAAARRPVLRPARPGRSTTAWPSLRKAIAAGPGRDRESCASSSPSWAPRVELPLTPEQGRALARLRRRHRGTVRRTAPGLWQVGPARKVGAARVGDIEIHIRRRSTSPGCCSSLGYSEHGAAWRPETVPVAEAADLVPAFAQALWRQTERAHPSGPAPRLRRRGGELSRSCAAGSGRASSCTGITGCRCPGDPPRRVHR